MRRPRPVQLGNRLDDLFGQRARIFCRYLLITVETGLAGAGSRRTSRYFHLPPDGTHEGGGRTTRQTRHRFALRGPEKRRGCSAATPHRDNLVASALAGALQNAVYQALAEASVASGTASAACSAGTRVGVCLLTGHRVGPACQYVRYRSHQAFCHQPILPIETVPVRPETRARSAGTSWSLMRTGMRCARRTQLKGRSSTLSSMLSTVVLVCATSKCQRRRACMGDAQWNLNLEGRISHPREETKRLSAR
jgi:hypothetical protein